MNVKRIEAVLNSRYAMQELECLQLGNLYVCADKTSEIGHLVYRQEDWCFSPMRSVGKALTDAKPRTMFGSCKHVL